MLRWYNVDPITSYLNSTWTIQELAIGLKTIDEWIATNENNSLNVWFSQDIDGDVTTVEIRRFFK